jgi:hypothetical protein
VKVDVQNILETLGAGHGMVVLVVYMLLLMMMQF